MDTITTIPDLLTLSGSAQPVMVSLAPEDSRLIAAAPELLAALKALRKAVICEPAMNNMKYDALGAQVNKAIAKAEGR